MPIFEQISFSGKFSYYYCFRKDPTRSWWVRTKTKQNVWSITIPLLQNPRPVDPSPRLIERRRRKTNQTHGLREEEEKRTKHRARMREACSGSLTDTPVRPCDPRSSWCHSVSHSVDVYLCALSQQSVARSCLFAFERRCIFGCAWRNSARVCTLPGSPDGAVAVQSDELVVLVLGRYLFDATITGSQASTKI